MTELELDLTRLAIPEWVDEAACTLESATQFDEIVGTAPTASELDVRTAVAERFCAGCPVARECAALADSLREPGVWGGSLRYVTGPEHPYPATYVAVPLVLTAVPSAHEVGEIARRRPHGQARSTLAPLLDAI